MSNETTMINLADLDAALCDDRDRFTLPDGRTLRLRIEPDDSDTFGQINGCDAYGRVAWCERIRCSGQHLPRPTGFTGRAVKLRTMGGDAFWWEPYYEGGPYTPPSTAERSFMAHLVTFGFKQVGLELRETVTDSRGGEHTVTVDTAWIGGVDTLDTYPDGLDGRCEVGGYLTYLLADLLDGLGIEVER